jgi:hypothetical protein
MVGRIKATKLLAPLFPMRCGIMLVLLFLLATEAFHSPVTVTQSSKRISRMSMHLGESTATARSNPIGRIVSRMSAEDSQWEEPFVPEQGGGGNGNKKNNKHPKDDSIGDKFQRWWNSDEGKDDVKTYFVSLGVALLLRLTIIEPRFIPSLSMYPTFEVGDQLAVEKVTKRLKPFYRQEVVVFHPPQTFRDIMVDQYGQDVARAKEALIKRIVAIEVRKGKRLWLVFGLSKRQSHVIQSDFLSFPFRATRWRSRGENCMLMATSKMSLLQLKTQITNLDL